MTPTTTVLLFREDIWLDDPSSNELGAFETRRLQVHHLQGHHLASPPRLPLTRTDRRPGGGQLDLAGCPSERPAVSAAASQPSLDRAALDAHHVWKKGDELLVLAGAMRADELPHHRALRRHLDRAPGG